MDPRAEIAHLIETHPGLLRRSPAALQAKARRWFASQPRHPSVIRQSILRRLERHPKQRAFVADPSRNKAAFTTRRAGKTWADAAILIIAATSVPGTPAQPAWAAYVAIDKIEARRLMWDQVKFQLDVEGIRYKANETRLEIRVEGGGMIGLWGADDKAEIEKFRGMPFSVVILDEAASFGPYFDRMCKEAIGPALSDYRGQLVMTGTAGASCVGYFYDVTTDIVADRAEGWSVHSWSVADNVFFPRWAAKAARGEDWSADVAEMMVEERTRANWTETSPGFLREWGPRWIRDVAGMVYRYSRERNGWRGELERNHNWMHVVGVDLGSVDHFAVVCLAFCPDDYRDVWVVDQYHAPGLDVTDCAEVLRGFMGRWNPIRWPTDTGGLGKQIADEICNRHGIPLTAATKTDKPSAIALFNADQARGLWHVDPDSELASQQSVLQWAPEKVGILEDPRYKNDLCDANLYAWRECLQYLHTDKPKGPEPGTPAWVDQQAAEDKERRKAALLRQRRRPA